MKSIFSLLKEQLVEDFQWSTYGYSIFFLFISITFNYIYDFEDVFLDSHLHRFSGFGYYTLFYAFGYYGIAIPQLLILKEKEILLKPYYWLKTGFFILVCGFSASFYLHWFTQNLNVSHYEQFYISHIVMNFSCFATTLTPLFLFWIVTKNHKESFYGFKFKNAEIKPYLYMLAFMFPLLLWASFQNSFQSTYPTMKSWSLNKPFGLNHLTTASFFELCYGFSFISVEVLFRGALIIGLTQLLGRNAILPMVSLYAFLHFGKPLPETIGSIFGAYILGTIALKKKHIFGGIIIHMGVALSMDFLAYFQYYIINPH